MKSAICSMLLVASCATPFVKNDGNNQWTLGRDVGVAPSLLDSAFTRQAEKQCPNGYNVVEKSRLPKTLADVGVQDGEDMYYWTVRCKSKQAH